MQLHSVGHSARSRAAGTPPRSATAPGRLLLPLLLTALALAAAVRPALAQPRASSELTCLNTLPSSVFTRVPVYLVINDRDPDAAKLLRHDAALLAERLATRMQLLLGGSANSLPAGEPRINWQSHDGALTVTVHRSGPVTWSIDTTFVTMTDSRGPRGAIPDSSFATWYRQQDAASLLLAEAMRAEVAADAPFFIWPADAHGDSLRFILGFTHATIKRSGVVAGSVHERPAFPAFTLDEPWTMNVKELKTSRVEYPSRSSSMGVAGTIILGFTIDTLGRVDMSSVRDHWVSKEPRPQGDHARHYAAFVDAARRSLVKSQHRPAQVGGCAVRQMVQKPYQYMMGN